MKDKPTVCILMSTFNGDKYLQEQIHSIFAQEDVDVKLVVRDDGSTDNTLDILKGYKDIKLIEGSNIGCEESFKYLLYMPNDADYFAFADQDDVWYPRKLISAIDNIKSQKADLSVCNLMLADAEMKHLIKPLFSKDDIDRENFRFKNYILGNFHGCTQVWTNTLHKIIQTYYPPVTYPHDLWVNSIANMVSTTIIDTECYIKYRIHSNNTSGLAKNTYQRILKGISRYIMPNHPTKDILCKQLLEGYSKYLENSDERLTFLLLISSYKKKFSNKLKLLFSSIINKTDFQHRCLYWICILVNKY